MLLISPSLLSADFTNLEREVAAMKRAGADMIHVDVMDGHFVPNITIGIPVVKSLRQKTDMFLDVHLMISDPAVYAPQFADAGADMVVFHVEVQCDVAAVAGSIRGKGKKAGVALKPGTPAEAVFPYLALLDMVLVMTVEPGFGGQSFMADMCPKIAQIRAECAARGIEMDIQVDGGISKDTVAQVASAGANVFVAGSALFSAPDYTAAVAQLRAAAEQTLSKI